VENPKYFGQEADLLPHARGFHGDQRDAGLGGDGLDPGLAIRGVRDTTVPIAVRVLRAAQVQRDAVTTQRCQATRVQHLGAGGDDLLGLVVAQQAEQARSRIWRGLAE